MFCQYHVTPCTENKSQVETLFCGRSKCIKTSTFSTKMHAVLMIRSWFQKQDVFPPFVPALWPKAWCSRRPCAPYDWTCCQQKGNVSGRQWQWQVSEPSNQISFEDHMKTKESTYFFCPPCILDLLTWLFFFLVFLFISSQIHCTKGKQDAKFQSKKARHKKYEDKL